jgi:serine phosphatase RsbU (regulator of sigma subunit)
MTAPGTKRQRLATLEAKLAAITTLIVMVVAGALFVELSAREQRRLVQSKATAATMLIRLLATGLAPALDFGDPADVAKRLEDLRDNADIVSAAVWSDLGSAPVAAWNAPGAVSAGRPAAGEKDGTNASHDYLTTTATIRGPTAEALGRVRIVFTLRPENEEFARARLRLFWVVAGIAAAMAVALALLARRYVAGPLARLAQAATALADGDLSTTVQIATDDEIGDLARAFNVMGKAVAFRQEQLKKEIDLAQRIQTSLLPRDLTVPGLELDAMMTPATQVGGDYYDVLPVANGAFIAMGDVSGHGLDAGLIMLMLQSIVASLVARDDVASPADVVVALNEVLYVNIRQRLGRDYHATLTVMHYRVDGSITFAGAHEDIIVYRAATQQVEVVQTPGTWVGGRRDIRRGTVDSTLTLSPGDVLLLHTDGATEIRNAQGREFSLERLADEFEKLATRPVAEIPAALSAAVLGWGKAEDDVTFLAFRYTGSPGQSLAPVR